MRPRAFAIYSGDDGTAVALMLLGGQGNVSVTANVAPRLMHELCMAAIQGDVQRARAIHLRCCRCTSSCSANPARRRPSGPCRNWACARHTVRLPMTAADARRPALVGQALRDAACC
jgi:4-hydroxy-tetrahydrodipicolinate synthase